MSLQSTFFLLDVLQLLNRVEELVMMLNMMKKLRCSSLTYNILNKNFDRKKIYICEQKSSLKLSTE